MTNFTIAYTVDHSATVHTVTVSAPGLDHAQDMFFDADPDCTSALVLKTIRRAKPVATPVTFAELTALYSADHGAPTLATFEVIYSVDDSPYTKRATVQGIGSEQVAAAWSTGRVVLCRLARN